MTRFRLKNRLLAGAPLLWLATGSSAAGPVDFDREVRPIFLKHCLACHGGVKKVAGLSLVSRESGLAETDSGSPAIEPGDPASRLLRRIADPDDASRMPPAEHGPRLTGAEIDTIRRWIDEGAEWSAPWPSRLKKPTAAPAIDDGWARSALDRFVFERLRAEGLSPAPEADRAAWLRRVSFDLVGLPPSSSLRDSFLADNSPEAHERVVDSLLESPHFGERWASVWLDLVRYGDTTGYERDVHRDVWPYRDWVIRAFDDDKPYDEFLLEQLAGDLLPEATLADRLATAMHRNTPTNLEGGTDDEEFRVEAVIDRVDTTWQAIGGLTFGCARCHDHPYDPITQRDYYRFLACLNSTLDADLAERFPRLPVPDDPARWDEADALDRESRAVREELHALGARLVEETAGWRGVAFDAAESTGETTLSLAPIEGSVNGSAAEGVEVRASGTITDRSKYTLGAPAPPGRLTALRVDALPSDLVEALRQPEMGFVLARLRLLLVRGDAEREVFFHTVFCDDPTPFFPARKTLEDNAEGWAAYSRMLRPHWAVLAVDEAIDGPIFLRDGDRLRLVMKHDKALDGQDAIVLRRLRVSLTGDRRWLRLADDERFRSLTERAAELDTLRGEIPSTRTPIMQRRPPGYERPTHRFERGNRLVKAERVVAGLPGAFGVPLPQDSAPRLEMARWFASAEHPLTARVWVNRIWAEIFGEGIVATLDDFGSTGADPSHPGLLDSLAERLVSDWQWRLKPLLREVVLSATYRQDARASADSWRRDPRNRLLARGPRSRLRAEMVRDQALMLSGRFNPTRYGPPVMPYQPEGFWRSVGNSETWQIAEDESRFRRAVYTYWKKTAAYPSLVAFDAPSRERCVAKRSTTNTPLQALVTMNDPAFYELAKGFAERMLTREGSPRERITWAYREATGSSPNSPSLDALVELHASASGSSESERHAMAVVASALLNLDATLSK